MASPWCCPFMEWIHKISPSLGQELRVTCAILESFHMPVFWGWVYMHREIELILSATYETL